MLIMQQILIIEGHKHGTYFTLFGALIYWTSSLQHMVLLSTTEAEYLILMDAMKEGVW